MEKFAHNRGECGIGILPMIPGKQHRQGADATFRNQRAFSLVEVIVALGVFTFAITALLGMLPVGLKSARSVQNEANAIHIASSIFGLWAVAPAGTSLTISNVFTNLGDVAASGSGTFYFDSFGSQVGGKPTAAVAMEYSAVSSGTPQTSSVTLTFHWPAQANTNAPGIQSRTFVEYFDK